LVKKFEPMDLSQTAQAQTHLNTDKTLCNPVLSQAHEKYWPTQKCPLHNIIQDKPKNRKNQD
jgi:hypothetical protein